MGLFTGSGRLALFVLATFVQDAVSVRRPEYLSHYHRSEYLAKARVAPRNEEDKDGIPVRRIIYVGPNYKEPPPSKPLPTTEYTNGKCCKIGERLAKEGMHCQFELYSPSRTGNHMNRAKVKVQNLSSNENISPGIMAAVYKSLSTKVSKCYSHRDMLQKCCNYRATFLSNMKKCKTMKGADRRQCRTKTRKSYGY